MITTDGPSCLTPIRIDSQAALAYDGYHSISWPRWRRCGPRRHIERVPGSDPRYDVFLSYSWDNLALAVAVQTSLQCNGLRVFRDEDEIRRFDRISPAIEAALAASRTLVALYTPQFPHSPYCQWELYTALTSAYAIDGHTERVLALLHGVDYEDVRPARLASARLAGPHEPLDTTTAWIADKLTRLDERTLGSAPRHRQPDWYPYPVSANRSFVGRFNELWDIHDALVTTDEAERRGPNVVQLVGLGGHGKTLLAEEYARRFTQDHPGGVYVFRGFGSHLSSRPSIGVVRSLRESQAAEIARRLDLRGELAAGRPADEVIRDHLQRDGRPYLWIVDDVPGFVDELTFGELIAPTPAGQTLVTTRGRGIGAGTIIAIEGLEPAAALNLLTARRPAITPDDRRHARELAVIDLGRHAQALSIAGGLAADDDFAGYAALRADLAREEGDALQLAVELERELPGGYQRTIAATILRSVEKLGPAGRMLLRAASLLAPAPIPQPLLGEALADDAGIDLRAVTDGLAAVEQRSLATLIRAGDPPLWTVHAIISRTVRFVDTQRDARVRAQLRLVEALNDRLDRSRDTLRYLEIAEYLPHVGHVAQGLASDDERHAVNETARAYTELGQLRRAADLYGTLYRTCQATLGDNDMTTLVALVGLSAVHGMLGDTELAAQLKVQAHRGLVEALGPDHPDAVTALNNVGVTYLENDEPARARDVFREVYRARRRLLGIQDAQTLVSLGNLAIAFGRLGQHKLSLRLRRPVYELMRRSRAADDPLTLEALNNLAAGYRAVGDMAAARDAFTTVYDQRRRVLGENHSETLAALNNIATTESDQDKALHLFEAVYRGLAFICELKEPAFVVALSNLLRAKGASAAAPGRLNEFLRADQVHRRLVDELGPDDPATMVALCHLAHATAILEQREDQREAAGVLITDAAEGLRETLGANHPDAALAERLESLIRDL